MAAIIIGHSYVKRVQRYILESKTSMLQLKQFSHVFLHGIGGLKIQNLHDEMHMIAHLECKVCILDIGSNDMCQDSNDVYKLVEQLLDIANKIVSDFGVKVVIMQQFNRVRRSHPEAYNAKITTFNRLLHRFCNQNSNGMISCHMLKNMWPKWRNLLISDGTHLTRDGCRRLCRNYRNALIKACPLKL